MTHSTGIEPQYSIADLASEFGITTRAIRFYDERGLIQSTRRGGVRFYNPAERVKLKLILRGKRFGFSLESIRQWLNLYDLGDGGVTQMTTWVENAKMQIGALRAQRDELEDAMAELQGLIDETEAELVRRAAKRAAE